MTAKQAYAAKVKEAKKLLNTCAAGMAAHGKNFTETGANNWGCVGDLTHAIELLQQIAAFMPAKKN